MKNTIIKKSIYLLFAALGIGLFTACNEDIHDFAKKTGSDAAHAVYIADSVFNYRISHSANAEVTGADTILIKFPVHSTNAVGNDVTVRLAIDNKLVDVYNVQHGTGYKYITNCSVSHSTLTIPKGQTQSADSVAIAYTGKLSALLDRNGYLLPVKITSYGGADVKIDYEERVAYLKINVSQQNGVYFNDMESSGEITNNPVLGIFDNDFNDIKFKLSSLYEIIGETKIVLSVNNSLVSDFNSRMGTEYQAVPESDFEPVEVTFPAGAKSVEGTFSYKGNVSTLTDMRGYVVPLEITSITGADIDKVNAQRVFYAIVFNSDLHSEYVASESDLGTKVTDRSKYGIPKLADSSGRDLLAAWSVPPYSTTFPNGYANEIFKNGSAGYMITSMSGRLLDITIDLGEEVQNITGICLSSSTSNNSMKAVDIYYATEAKYAAGLSSFAGKIERGGATQNMYVKISEPVTARYLRFSITPSSAAVRLSQFYIYTGN
ncbi:BT_3987 domain-containing protein [Dysgonomonas reticulitermitis]